MTVAPYDAEALWTKAKLFANRAMDPGDAEFDERALWASLALELLGKAALARHSPSLIAVPTEDGVNLLIASGLVEGTGRFTSIPAKTVFNRCQRAFKPFDGQRAMAIANARNEYLHGARPAFTDIPEPAWWPRYWAQASILVTAMDRDIADLVGGQRAYDVEKHLAQNAKNLEHRIESLIARARQRLSMHRSGTLPARLAQEWSSPPPRVLFLHSTAETCPACGGPGKLLGDDVVNAEIYQEQVAEDEFDVRVDLTVSADRFECVDCRLVLDEYELLEAANVSMEFKDVGDADGYFSEMADEYGND